MINADKPRCLPRLRNLVFFEKVGGIIKQPDFLRNPAAGSAALKFKRPLFTIAIILMFLF
jgi:hypothetical protein